MKHFALFLCLLWLVPACGLCEKILWEDDAGQVVLGDDGNVQFVSSRPAKVSAVCVKTDKLWLSASDDKKTNSDLIAKAAENIKSKGFDAVFVEVPEERGFACTDGAADYWVFVNARTGETEQLLRVITTEQGEAAL